MVFYLITEALHDEKQRRWIWYTRELFQAYRRPDGFIKHLLFWSTQRKSITWGGVIPMLAQCQRHKQKLFNALLNWRLYLAGFPLKPADLLWPFCAVNPPPCLMTLSGQTWRVSFVCVTGPRMKMDTVSWLAKWFTWTQSPRQQWPQNRQKCWMILQRLQYDRSVWIWQTVIIDKQHGEVTAVDLQFFCFLFEPKPPLIQSFPWKLSSPSCLITFQT